MTEIYGSGLPRDVHSIDETIMNLQNELPWSHDQWIWRSGRNGRKLNQFFHFRDQFEAIFSDTGLIPTDVRSRCDKVPRVLWGGRQPIYDTDFPSERPAQRWGRLWVRLGRIG